LRIFRWAVANLVLDGERGATALDLLVSGLVMRKIIEEPQSLG